MSILAMFGLLCGCNAKVEEGKLPEKYSLVEEERITPYKNQHQSGMCWAYSAAAAAESSLITSGFEKPMVDLSEGHIVYTVYPFEEDRNADSMADGFFITGDKKKNAMFPCYIGGMSSVAAMKFALGEGLIYEEEAPFGTDAGELKKSVDNYLALEEAGAFTEKTDPYLLTRMILFEKEEEIKEGIMKFGAVCTGIIADQKGFSMDPDGNICYFYTQRDPAYRFSIRELPETNHVVTIAGWNDRYPARNFAKKPGRNGAWLVKDSMAGSRESGMEGYFWMSYEEFTAGTIGMEFVKRADYGRVLAYDDIGPADFIRAEGEEETVIANVFSPDPDEALKAVGVFAGVKGQQVRIEVYRNPETGSPDSGEKLCEKEAMIGHIGYEVIRLDAAVSFASGETFSIVVTYANTEGVEMIAPVEGDASGLMKPNPLDTLYLTSGEGESYAKCGGVWYDLSKPETAKVFHKTGTINNASIKALFY